MARHGTADGSNVRGNTPIPVPIHVCPPADRVRASVLAYVRAKKTATFSFFAGFDKQREPSQPGEGLRYAIISYKVQSSILSGYALPAPPKKQTGSTRGPSRMILP